MTIANATPHATYEGLLVQFRALRTLAASNEERANHLDRQLRDQTQAQADLEAERATNAQLTEALLAAETERDALREQVRVFTDQGRMLMLAGCEVPEGKLLWGAMHNLHGNRRNTLPRWALVRDALGIGSGVATALCRRFDLNPDEVLKS